MESTQLGKQFVAQVQAQDIFKRCIAEHGEWLKGYMYMYTDQEQQHHFKNIITRRYVAVKA